MLQAYSANQTIAAGGLVPFTSVSLVKGTTVVLSGSTSIQFNKCGVYEVSCVVTGLPAAAGDVTIQMTKNGVAQPQAITTVADAATATGVTVPITTLVQVSENNSACCCKAPTVIQFVCSGVGLTAANSNVVVTRIC